MLSAEALPGQPELLGQQLLVVRVIASMERFLPHPFSRGIDFLAHELATRRKNIAGCPFD